jgi:hypothetical protein
VNGDARLLAYLLPGFRFLISAVLSRALGARSRLVLPCKPGSVIVARHGLACRGLNFCPVFTTLELISLSRRNVHSYAGTR